MVTRACCVIIVIFFFNMFLCGLCSEWLLLHCYMVSSVFWRLLGIVRWLPGCFYTVARSIELLTYCCVVYRAFWVVPRSY